MELASRKTILASGPPTASTGRTYGCKRSDQTIKKLLWHGGRPHMGPGLRRDDAGDYLRSSSQIAQRRDDLLRAVGLWHKAAAFGQVVFSDTDEAGGCDDLDRRPSAPDKSGEVQAIHRARHLDIGEYDVNVGARFEYRNR